EQVGMKNDNTVIFETDAPRTVTLRLPEDTLLTLPLTLLTFDNYGRDPSGDNQNPTGLDGKTDRVPLDETVELYRSTLDQLNMGTDTIADFQKQASAADGAQHPAKRITSQPLTKRVGYIEIQLHAEYEPDNQVGFIQFSGAWGPLLHDYYQTPTRRPYSRAMIKTLKQTMLTIVVAIVLVSATGCTLTPGTNSDDDDASPQSWDLREPPTREQVGMKDDEDDVFALYDTDEPHQVDLKLPENTTLTLPLTLLTFNSPRLAPSDPQPPTSLDGKTDRVPLDETVELYRSTLDQL